jgi:hypothetical protein
MDMDEKFFAWLGDMPADVHDPKVIRHIEEAAYTISENEIIGVSVRAEDLIFAWRVVEIIRRSGYPDDLKM